MNVPRRLFLRLAAGAAALPAVSRFARAETYPARPVNLIVGFPAGNAPDIIARLIGQWLSKRLGQQFVVQNRPGAAGNIATEAAMRAPADGYTLHLIVLTNSFNATLYENPGHKFPGDISPIGSIANVPFVMVVHPSLPAKTVSEFIAYAQANPGKINMGSGGIGSATHVFGELFKNMAGVDLFHVPYRGSFMPDLLSGRLQFMMLPITNATALAKAGKVRALAVTTPQRLEALPDLPALGEFVPGYQAVGWLGLSAPKNTPTAIIDTINSEINAGLADPELMRRLADLGSDVLPSSPAGFGKFIADETEKWARTIKLAGIKRQ